MKTKLNNLFFFISIILMPLELISSTINPAIVSYLLSSSQSNKTYILHEDITVTIFWTGEEAGDDNGDIPNLASAWDEMWMLNYGGVDTPDERNEYHPASFTPTENPFYFALPYNDYDEDGEKKTDGNCAISNCKNRWIKIIKDEKIAYAQWEDVGPFLEDDVNYVFGTAEPSNHELAEAGLDVSPAVRDYLTLGNVDTVDWQFINEEDVPEGPWKDIVTTSGINWIDWYKPDVNTSWQWQLQPKDEEDTINTSYDVDIYDIDLFDSNKTLIQSLHNDGRKVICYFSGGSWESWREDADDFPEEVKGKDMDGWEEKWLDISNDALKPIMTARLDLAQEKGCDGVEPDNMDGYTPDNDTGFDLTAEHQLAYNKFIATEARKRGLSVGLKNDLNQVVELEAFFDFSVNEQCHEYDECELLKPFIEADKPVFNAEYKKKYKKNTNGARDEICSRQTSENFQILVLPEYLDDAFTSITCD